MPSCRTSLVPPAAYVTDNGGLRVRAPQVTGVLDWGDAAYCWRVVELAVAVTYAMLLAAAPAASTAGAGAGSGAGAGAPAGCCSAAGDEDAPLRVGANIVVGTRGCAPALPVSGRSGDRPLGRLHLAGSMPFLCRARCWHGCCRAVVGTVNPTLSQRPCIMPALAVRVTGRVPHRRRPADRG